MIILGSFPIFWSSFRLFPQIETGEVKKEVLWFHKVAGNSSLSQLSHTATNFIDHEISLRNQLAGCHRYDNAKTER